MFFLRRKNKQAKYSEKIFFVWEEDGLIGQLDQKTVFLISLSILLFINAILKLQCYKNDIDSKGKTF